VSLRFYSSSGRRFKELPTTFCGRAALPRKQLSSLECSPPQRSGLALFLLLMGGSGPWFTKGFRSSVSNSARGPDTSEPGKTTPTCLHWAQWRWTMCSGGGLTPSDPKGLAHVIAFGKLGQGLLGTRRAIFANPADSPDREPRPGSPGVRLCLGLEILDR
jgi:hypothetical protein